MNKKALLQQVQAATREEQQLIERVLASPAAIKPSLLEALSEMSKPTARSKFLQYVLTAAVAVSRSAKITTDADLDEHQGGFEAMVEVFARPEALLALAPNDPLAAVRFKGVQVKHELLYQDGQPLTSEEVAQLLHITRQAVDKRRSKGQLLGVSLGRRGYLYPAWQFHSGQVLPGLERVLAALKDYDPWTQLMFLKTGEVRLDGATPLERLQAGDIDAVVWAAECYGTHGAA
jgi:biotin operon repressor